MKIQKFPYSRGAWRLVNSQGQEVVWRKPFDHPGLGMTVLDQTICGDTKAECMEQVFEFVGYLMALNRKPPE